MRSGYIVDLEGHYGNIRSDEIWKRVSTYSLDSLTLDIRQVTMDDIDYVFGHGLTPILMLDPVQWFNVRGATAADKMNELLNGIGFKDKLVAKYCPVLFDYEFHSIQDIIDLITRWRKLRYKRDTYLSMEPLQGGWFSDFRIVTLVNNDINLKIVPQTYRGGHDNVPPMFPVAQDACYRDMFLRGFDASRIKLFYGLFWRDLDGQDHYSPVPEAMDGFLWTFEKLPIPSPR